MFNQCWKVFIEWKKLTVNTARLPVQRWCLKHTFVWFGTIQSWPPKPPCQISRKIHWRINRASDMSVHYLFIEQSDFLLAFLAFYGLLTVILKLNNCTTLKITPFGNRLTQNPNFCLALTNSMMCHNERVSIKNSRGFNYLARWYIVVEKVCSICVYTIRNVGWPTTLNSKVV